MTADFRSASDLRISSSGDMDSKRKMSDFHHLEGKFHSGEFSECTEEVCQRFFVRWRGRYNVEQDIQERRYRSSLSNLVKLSIVSILGVMLYSVAIIGTRTFAQKPGEGVWGNAWFVGAALTLSAQLTKHLGFFVLAERHTDHQAFGYRCDMVVAYWVDLIFFSFYRIVFRNLSNFEELFSLLVTRGLRDIFENVVRFHKGVYIFEWRCWRLIYKLFGYNAKCLEDMRNDSINLQAIAFGVRLFADLVSISIILAISYQDVR